MEATTITNTFPTDTVKNLKLDIASAKVCFGASTNERIHVKADILPDDTYTCEMWQDTLSISHKWHKRKIVNSPESLIVLYLPADFSFAHIDCNLGAGKLKIGKAPLSCGGMDIDIGAGEWKAAHLTVSGRLAINIGAGKVKLQDTKSGNLHLSCGAGHGSYKGRIDGDFHVSCGVGTCLFELENKETDYDYDISCALGSISVNEHKIRNLGCEKRRNGENALGKAALECGVGKIILKTT